MASRVVRETHSDVGNYFTAVELLIHGWERQENPQNFKTGGKAIPILLSSKGSGVFDSFMQWSHTVLTWSEFLQETTENGTATRAQMVSLGLGAGHACNPHALWQKTTKLLQDSPSRPGSYFFICTEQCTHCTVHTLRSVQHTYTCMFPTSRDTPLPFSAVQLPFLAFTANTEFIHRAPHCCCGTEEENLSWSSCPSYWRFGGMLW